MTDEIRVEMGSHQRLTIDKLFGPTAFADLRVSCDMNTCEWVIERTGPARVGWVEVARVPGQLATDYVERALCPVCQDDPPIRARGGSACPHCGHTQESRIAVDEAQDPIG